MSTNSDNSQRAKWDLQRQEVLLDELIIQVNLGKRADNSFKAEAWEGAKNGLNQACGTRFTIDQIKTMWNVLRPKYALVKQLRALSGFGWNPVNHHVEADDSVWDTYLRSHLKAKEFRGTPFPLYDKLAQLCDGKVVTGMNALTIAQASSSILHYEIILIV
jgi:hypothetical protein